MQCSLCNENEANQTGSHIVPHFLLKRIENVQGKKGRDNELGFSISGLNQSSHFGRAVSPEKLEEIYGEVTDEDIEKNQHPSIVDNIFCRQCEKRLSVVESEYAKTISKVDSSEYASGVSGSLGILFWSSIIWRMSINGNNGVTLKPEEEELLRRILHDHLPEDISGMNQEAMESDTELIGMSYRLMRCIDAEEEDPKWLFWHPKFYSVDCLLIAEYQLALSIGNDFSELNSMDCCGISSEFLSAATNSIQTDERINPIERDSFLKIGENIVGLSANYYLEQLSELLDRLHVVLGGQGKYMPDSIKQAILDEIASGEKKLGRRYGQKELFLCIKKVTDKFSN